MPFTFGNAFNRFFRLLGGNFVPFFIIGLICTILPTMAVMYFEFTYMGVSQTDPTWVNRLSTLPPTIWGYAGVTVLVSMLLNLVTLSVITEVAILRSVDKPLNFGAIIGNALKNAIPLLVIEIFAGLLVGLGFILILVPGIIWALCTCVAIPSYVGQPGVGIFGAIGKSFQLTRNHRWSLLLLFVVMFIITAIASGALTATTIGLPGGIMGLPSLLTRGFISGVIALFWHVFAASLYVSLREDKEKLAPDTTASVF